ncbi:glycerol-3-phosphate dehydrogenase/oxidase [Arthrobacter sp. FW306-07-I]|uniref:glycerol-3-phosphate dehydrogenase/oxidase n=1 Tax=Arthrobacter sp. FW306-07-I TaxID=2879622 RepID=UPI001F1BEF08|nr:glycerol-3-phosphate dehydrogenase/oxidase [Arthrobacter sp. FW306-07-I]UKA73693.1 glycerol-3-phosphate dehydrogenase/oxidase [Arthrobacter sp. FW306-07-I]
MGPKDSSAQPSVSAPLPRAERPSVHSLRRRPHAKVLVVGGGINGVGTFRDLALQGVDVALVERGDYCQGASGASSHMIHGGIRYLENGEFRLVRESVVERNRLLKIAPHYVKPLQTTIPIFSTFSGILSAPLRFLTHKQQGKPKERGAFLIKAGLSLYDSFSRDGGTVPRHQFRTHKAALQELPDLRPDVKYTATYFDASVHNPERLTLDVLQDGEKAGRAGNAQAAGAQGNTARASNYLSLQSMSSAPNPGTGRGSTVRLRDELTGEEFDFTADIIVNTTGAWVDLTNESMGAASSFMGGTKGSHIVLDHPGLLAACRGREIFFEHTDGRIVLIYPMGDRVLVGTTDVDADMTEDAICTDEEIQYFFDLIGHVFPSIAVTPDDIVYTFSGVRPLPSHDATQPGFVSRDYRIERRASGDNGSGAIVLSLVGGKWTTFRALAEHLTNEVLSELGVQRKVSTAQLPIGGGAGFPADEAGEQKWIKAHMGAGRDADRTAGLLTRYGTRAEAVISYLDAEPDQPLRSTRELTVRELGFMAANEQVGHLVDVFIRRTSLAFRGLVTGELLNEVAEVLSVPLKWDAATRAAEIKHAQDVLQRFHRVETHSLVS